jgi:hypothetical protein
MCVMPRRPLLWISKLICEQVISTGEASVMTPIISNAIFVLVAIFSMYINYGSVFFCYANIPFSYLISAYYQRKLSKTLSAFQDGEVRVFSSKPHLCSHFFTSVVKPLPSILESSVHVNRRGRLSMIVVVSTASVCLPACI